MMKGRWMVALIVALVVALVALMIPEPVAALEFFAAQLDVAQLVAPGLQLAALPLLLTFNGDGEVTQMRVPTEFRAKDGSDVHVKVMLTEQFDTLTVNELDAVIAERNKSLKNQGRPLIELDSDATKQDKVAALRG